LSNNLKIGFAGLSHLGITTSIAVSKFKELRIIAFDNDVNLINKINKSRKITIKEPKINTYLNKYYENINYVSDPNELKKCDIVYISKDTETNRDNMANLTDLNDYVNYIIKFLNKKTILVIHSQIQLNFMTNINWSKNKLFYHVETLIFGKALDRVLNPERIIIGCNDINKNLPIIFKKYINLFNSKLILMNYQSAELTKITINLFLISSISITNKISELCEKNEADWSNIREAIISDKRIGKYSYTNPGLGISGGNLERDLMAIMNINKKFNINNSYFESIKKISVQRKKWILETLSNLNYYDNESLKIGILGVCYKSNTNSIKNSAGIEVLKKFKKSLIKFYDPLVLKSDIINLHNRVKNLKDIFYNIDILIITNDWSIYNKLTQSQLKKIKDKIIIDPFNILNKFNLKKLGIRHIILGKKI
jgi:UDPglucose 6-dehydrogenase